MLGTDCSILYRATHIALFLPLQEVEEVQLLADVGSPRDVCLKHALKGIDMMWAYRRSFSLRHSSCVGLLGPFMVVVTLSPQLRDSPQKIEPFIRACQALSEQADNFPIASYILAMLKALDMEHNLEFPEEVRAVLLKSGLQQEDLKDIQMEMRIPIPPRPPGTPRTVTSCWKYSILEIDD